MVNICDATLAAADTVRQLGKLERRLAGREEEAVKAVRPVGGRGVGVTTGSPARQFAAARSRSRLRSLSSGGLAPVEDNEAGESGHSSLATRSLYSKSIATTAPSDRPDPIHIIKSKMLNKRAVLNIGGVRHEVRQNTLPRYETLLVLIIFVEGAVANAGADARHAAGAACGCHHGRGHHGRGGHLLPHGQ